VLSTGGRYTQEFQCQGPSGWMFVQTHSWNRETYRRDHPTGLSMG